jgi:thiosulfate dehydrogenase [quinone] large subunit
MAEKLQKWDSMLFPLALSGTRTLIGLMWLLSLRWKLPPTFAPTGGRGLMDWMELQVTHPTLGLYADFVANIVLPNFLLFAWLTFLIELAIGLSLTFGLFTRLGALLGLLWSFNLAIGLLEVPGEWPWSYLMLIMWHGLFLVSTQYQLWGIDTWWQRRKSHQT